MSPLGNEALRELLELPMARPEAASEHPRAPGSVSSVPSDVPRGPGLAPR